MYNLNTVFKLVSVRLSIAFQLISNTPPILPIVEQELVPKLTLTIV